ncbi:hypothetical protein QUB33_02725 [Microcoleus sp. B3-A4]
MKFSLETLERLFTLLTQVEQVEIEYPSSDGNPMAESGITRD